MFRRERRGEAMVSNHLQLSYLSEPDQTDFWDQK
jgi:hypothetical protein